MAFICHPPASQDTIPPPPAHFRPFPNGNSHIVITCKLWGTSGPVFGGNELRQVPDVRSGDDNIACSHAEWQGLRRKNNIDVEFF